MISKERIENCVKCLMTLQSISVRNNNYISTIQRKEICKKYKMSRDILTRAIELKYVIRLSEAKYKFILLDIQPFHGRKVLELMYSKITEYKNRSKTSSIKKEKKSFVVTKKNNDIIISKIKKPVKTPIKTKKIVETANSEKQLSILWGLFSWKRKN